MLRSLASFATLVLIVASCSPAASPRETAVEPSPTSSLAAASAVANVTSPPVATTSPTPTRSQRLDDIVTSFKLVGPGTGWAETNHGLLVTNDDGYSWVDAGPNGDLRTFGLDAIDRQTAFVASEKKDASTTTIS